jgi:hypothetical protein
MQDGRVLHYAVLITSSLASPNSKGERMKRFAMSLILTAALVGTAMAGDIPSTGLVSSQPTQPDETAVNSNVPSTDLSLLSDMPAIDQTIVLAVLDLLF